MNTNMNRDGLNYLSIAAKAGLIKSGEFQTEYAVKSGDACILIVADDASEGTKKKFANMAEYYNVPIIYLSTKETLGRLIGKDSRSSMTITDKKLAEAFMKKLGR